MKKAFFTGLVILLPATLTFLIVLFFVNFLALPFCGLVSSLFKYYGILSNPPLWLSKGIALIIAIGLIFLAGLLTRWIFVRYFFDWTNLIFHRIPMINTIYKAVQDVIHPLLSPDSTSFSQVVLAPFPCQNSYCIGLIPAHNAPSLDNSVSVLILGTPNPLMGFLLSYPKSELIFIDMKVDQAIKFVISCGIILPEQETPT